jgi:hypothetical protein
MKRMASAAAAGALALWTAGVAHAADPSIHIVSAQYGRPNVSRVRDFSDRLQNTCGPSASYCEAFCSDATAGVVGGGLHWPFSHRPVCRVTYRCGVDTTRAVDAEQGETIVLQCR